MDNSIRVKGRDRRLNVMPMAASNLRAIRRAAPVEMTEHYANIEPSRADVDALEGPVLLEFGTAGAATAAPPNR